MLGGHRSSDGKGGATKIHCPKELKSNLLEFTRTWSNVVERFDGRLAAKSVQSGAIYWVVQIVGESLISGHGAGWRAGTGLDQNLLRFTQIYSDLLRFGQML